MNDEFTNSLDLFTLGMAFSVWFAHFMLAWTISSIFPGEGVVLWLTLALTLVALGALGWLWRRSGQKGLRTFSVITLAIATIAVLFDFAPALMA